jgi:two-component system, NarL family, sensor kinase
MSKLLLFFLLFFILTEGKSQNIKQCIDSARIYKNKDYSKSINWAKIAYNDAIKKKELVSIGESAYLIGVANYLQGNFKDALNWYFEAEKYYTTSNTVKGNIELYSDMCILYLRLKKSNEATLAVDKAISLCKAEKDTSLLATAYNNKGLVFLDTKIIDSAIVFFKKSLNLYKSINDKQGMAYSLDYLSSAQSENLDFDNALITLNESIKLRKGIGDKTGEAIAINNIGEIYLKQKLPKLASAYFLESIKIAHEINYADLEMYAYDMLSQTYQLENNYKEALLAQTKYLEINKKVLDEKKIKAIEELQTKYETAKKEQQIKTLNDQSTIQQLKINKKNSILFIVIAGFLLILFSAWQFYKNYKAKQSALLQAAIITQQDIATKGIIEAEERERKRIASDLHDGVGQLMTAAWLNMQAINEKTKNTDKETAELLDKAMHLVDESCKEVRAVSHNMMPNALLKKGLINAVREFLQQINVKSTKINLQTENLHNPLPSNVEMVLYRVIQESVNNVIKHAQATSLDISINQDEAGIDVMIEDNGKGFNFEQANNKDGIGLQNIKSRIEYLKGTVEWNTAENKGTLVAIHIPETK